MVADKAIELAESIIDKIDEEVSDEAKDRATEFFESVREGALSLVQTIQRTGRVSDKQAEALRNWDRGVSRWIH